MSRLPLLGRPLDAVLSWRNGEAIGVARFLFQARALACRLGDGEHVVNLCRDRYAFSVTFAATILAGKTNLLPANRQTGTLEALTQRFGDASIVSDCITMTAAGPLIDPTPDLALVGAVGEVPQIKAEHLAAVVFTSGSTGESSAIAKPWKTLYHSTRLNARELGLGDSERDLQHGLATVPPQHMWGLETSVLLPWFAPLTMAPEQPLFVADIVKALQRLPQPRVLISTPVHLRALAQSPCESGLLHTVYSATAPLGAQLALRLGSTLGTRVVEVFGSSETGCFASRCAASDEPWRLFPAFTLEQHGENHIAHAEHLPAPVPLMDRVSMQGSRHFRICGRNSDLINIAGKRASLAELTQLLLDIPGVIDGVFLQPPDHDDGRVSRLAALVVAPGVSCERIRAALALRVDPAFMPRPLRRVEALPRADSGKLPRQALYEFFERTG